MGGDCPCFIILVGVGIMAMLSIVFGAAAWADSDHLATLRGSVHGRYMHVQEVVLGVRNVSEPIWNVTRCRDLSVAEEAALVPALNNSCVSPDDWGAPCLWSDRCGQVRGDVCVAMCDSLCSAVSSQCTSGQWEGATDCRVALADSGCAYQTPRVYRCFGRPEAPADAVTLCSSTCSGFRCEPYDESCGCSPGPCVEPLPDALCWVAERPLAQSFVVTYSLGYTVDDQTYPTRLVGPLECNSTDREPCSISGLRSVYHHIHSQAFRFDEPLSSDIADAEAAVSWDKSALIVANCAGAGVVVIGLIWGLISIAVSCCH